MNVSNQTQQTVANRNDAQNPSRWKEIALFTCAGVLAATQIGKAHIALPEIELNLAHGLTDLSWIISALSVMAVLFAVPAGAVAAKVGTKRSVVIGLFVLSFFSLAGSFSRNENELLLSRIGEGAGYLVVVVAVPSIIALIAHPKDHLIALGAWGAFLPGGVAIATLLGPYAMLSHGWRGLWAWSALALFLFAVLIQFSTEVVSVGNRLRSDAVKTSFNVYKNRPFLILAGLFACYTLQHLGMMSLFPSYLIKVLGASPTLAGLLNSISMALNIVGNVAAGFLLRRGVPIFTVIPAALLVMAISGLLIFESGNISVAFAGASAFCAVGGAIPGAVLAVLPSYSRSQLELAPGNGLLVQGSNLGILIGPLLVTAIGSQYGWSWVPLVSLISLLGGSSLLLLLPRGSYKSL